MINIYKITNKKNNKIYIGQTINSIEYRFKQHLRETRGNNKLHKDMRKQNKQDFEIILIDIAYDERDADEKERFWINFYNSTCEEYGYNLDTGGKSDCKKSKTALKPMRDAVLRSWDDYDTAEKMLYGLRKGTEIWKEKCREKRIKFICPICGEEAYMCEYEIKNRSTCGKSTCKNKYSKIHKTYIKGLNKANEVNKNKYREESLKIKEYVLNWAKENKEVVLNCPKNKIITTLNDLILCVEKEFNIKDIRSISKKCCGTNSKIKFLEWLQKNIKNN